MSAGIDEKDKRGYSHMHRAFQTRDWGAIKEAYDSGAELNVLTPSGATLEDFADGLGLSELFLKLQVYNATKE